MPNSDPDGTRLLLRIVSVKPETKQAKTYVFEPVSGKVPDYRPGQFLTFLVGIEGRELRRSFSIISLPGEPLAVTIKRVENGAVSRYLLQEWKTGDVVESLPPAGRFVVDVSPVPRDLFFIVAGSGITPALPQIRYLLQSERNSLVHLVYSNRSEADTLFRKEIDALKTGSMQLNVYEFISQPLDPFHRSQRLNNGPLEALVKRNLLFDPADAVFMLCGPFTFMRMARITLIFMHFAEAQIKRENFLPGIMKSAPEKPHAYPPRNVEIQFNGQTRTVSVGENQSILRAALSAGIPLPYSCEGGVCSTCAARCERGNVEMSVNEVLTDKDLAEGWILTCTGHPVNDEVLIRFPPVIN